MKNVNIFYLYEILLYIFTIVVDIHAQDNHNIIYNRCWDF